MRQFGQATQSFSLSGAPATGLGLTRAADGSMVWTDLATPAQLDARAPALSAVAPSSPAVGDRWLSTSLRDLRISRAQSDRVVIVPGGAYSAQEPKVWLDNTSWHMLAMITYNAANDGDLRHLTCPLNADPLLAANWTLDQTLFLGNGYGGIAAQIPHCGFTYDPVGGNIYIFFSDYAAHKLRVAYGPDIGHLTVADTGLDRTTVTNANDFFFGHAINDGGVWKLLFCATITGETYGYDTDGGYATASAPEGPYTLVKFPFAAANSNDCGYEWFTKEPDGTFVAWMHQADINNPYGHAPTPSAGGGSLPTRAYVTTSSDMQTWAAIPIHDPLIDREIACEIDQVADVWPVIGPDGTTPYVFWSGNDNSGPGAVLGSIVGTVAQPMLKRWTGVAWVPNESSPPSLPMTTYKRALLGGSTDFTMSTTANSTSFVPVVPATTATGVNALNSATVNVGDTANFPSTGSFYLHTSLTTATGANVLDSTTINVMDTSAFPSAGDFYLLGRNVVYTGKTATSFTGCSGHAATTGGEMVSGSVTLSTLVAYAGKTSTSFTGCGAHPATVGNEAVTSATNGCRIVYTPTRNERARVRFRARVNTSQPGEVRIGFTIAPLPKQLDGSTIVAYAHPPSAGAVDCFGFRTFQSEEIFDFAAGVTYTIQGTVKSGIALNGITVTVDHDVGSTNLVLEASNVR